MSTDLRVQHIINDLHTAAKQQSEYIHSISLSLSLSFSYIHAYVYVKLLVIITVNYNIPRLCNVQAYADCIEIVKDRLIIKYYKVFVFVHTLYIGV